ncbi:MAG: hypothetical protein P0S95_06760 [Rhabdochlamydiaceae bacterium]|nr:hypothetical protein [Candidatus Amphrikana amoebophyrae]
MEDNNEALKGFRKKVYTKLTTSKLTDQVSHSISQISEAKGKKIVPTQINPTLREGFKKMFLPLLIDIFELRQATQTCHNKIFSDEVLDFSISNKTPEQILEKLEEIQKQVQEAQNWCDGVVLQISKGIIEAKDVLKEIEEKNCEEKGHTKKKNFLKSIVDLFHTG